MLPSHNCIIITMFSFQGASLNLFFKKLNEASTFHIAFALFLLELQSVSYLKWWAKMDSNHRPHDYQSCALAS